MAARNIEPFVEKGYNYDEVVFNFGDKGQLFVSKGFIIQASPVFRAMFEDGHFKKSSEGKVEIQDCSRENFLEFLHCLDPATMKEVEEENFNLIADISEKYQVQSLISKCKDAMENILEDVTDVEDQYGFDLSQLEDVVKCLRILQLDVVRLNYKPVFQKVLTALSYFGSMFYTLNAAKFERLVKSVNSGTLYEGVSIFQIDGNVTTYYSENSRRLLEMQKECHQRFSKLPADVKNTISRLRLSMVEDNKFRIRHPTHKY